MTNDCRSHTYRSAIRNTGQNRAPRIRRCLALSVGADAAFKRIGALLLMLSVIGWPAAVAAAAQARRKHAIKLTIVENQISTTNPNPAGPPPLGTTTVRAGVASLTPGRGRGADVDHVTITSLSLATRSATFKGRVTFFFRNGTLSAKSLGRVTIQMDGSVTFRGATTLTSGTGAYRGVTGHLRFTGASPNKPGAVTTIHLTGRATY